MTTMIERKPTTEREAQTLAPRARFDEIFRDMEELWGRAWPFRYELFRKRPEHGAFDFDWIPKIDVHEKDGELLVRADLPGIKKEEIELYFEEGDLVLKGERRFEKETKEKEIFRSERMHGTFFRRIPLGFEIDPSMVKTKFENGVLELGIPMPPETKPEPKKIAIA